MTADLTLDTLRRAQALFDKHAPEIRRTMRWPHLNRRSMAMLRRKFMSRHSIRQRWKRAP